MSNSEVSIKENPTIETPTERVSTQESLPTNNSQQNDFAAMNGVNIEVETPEQPTELQKEIPEPEEIITTRGVSQQPLVKAIVVGCGIFLVVGFIGLIAVANCKHKRFKLQTRRF